MLERAVFLLKTSKSILACNFRQLFMFAVGIKLGQAMLISGSIQGKNFALSQPWLYFYPSLPLSWLVYAGLVQVFMINGIQMLL